MPPWPGASACAAAGSCPSCPGSGSGSPAREASPPAAASCSVCWAASGCESTVAGSPAAAAAAAVAAEALAALLRVTVSTCPPTLRCSVFPPSGRNSVAIARMAVATASAATHTHNVEVHPCLAACKQAGLTTSKSGPGRVRCRHKRYHADVPSGACANFNSTCRSISVLKTFAMAAHGLGVANSGRPARPCCLAAEAS